MSNEPLTAPDGTPLDTRGRLITPARLRHALIVNIWAGTMGSAWYGVFGGGSQIFQVFFQNHVGASSRQLGWLTALGAFLAPLQLVSILIYSHLKTRKNFWVIGTAIHRLLGLVLAFVAVYIQVLAKDSADPEAAAHYREVGIYLILVASASSWVLAQLSGVAWQSWMADLVPEHIRASFFGRRGAIISFANMLYYLLIQLSLDYVPMYWQGVPILYVYAVVFAVTGAFGTLDIIIHSTIPEPKRHPGETQVGWREFFEPVMNPNFLRFSLAIGLFGFTTGIFSPFQAPYVSLDLEKGGFIGASNKWVWVMMAVPGAIGIFTLTAWGHMMDRFGRKPVVVLGALFPLAWVAYLFLTPANYWIIIPLVAVAVGLLSAGYMTGVFQLMLTLAPQKNRTGYAAWHNSVAGVIGASGSILGGYLKQYAETVQLHTQIRGIEINFPTEVMGFPFSSFHVVGVLCFVLMVPTLIMLSRIREGKERPVGFLVSLLTNPGTYRTFLDLGAIGRASSPRRTARALRHLDGISGNLALAEVLARLDDPDPDVREEAARALGRIRAPETVEPLIQHLRDPACTIRPEAAYALGQIGDARAVPALVENLSSPTPEIQDACARALEMIRKPRPRSERSAAALRTLEDPPPDILINMIIERLDDTDADVREAAVRALGRRRSPDAIEALVARLRDPGSKIRSQAALTLGEIGDAQAIPALVDCLSDPSVEVQDACARALGDIGSREAVRHLMRLVHEKSSERVMAAGAEAVSRHGIVEAAWEIVPRMHETSNPVLRRQLAIAAGNLLGTPGEFYVHLRGETSQPGRRLGRLFSDIRKAIRSFRPVAVDSREHAFLKAAEADLRRLRALMEAQAYREMVDGLYEHMRGLVRLAIDRDCNDEMALEYALACDVGLGIGFWFMQEAREHMKKSSDPDMLHTDALLALYFFSQYRLPSHPRPPRP